ncbi:MAG: glycosyltransferase family 4 protein [Parcubacteria group bacterium]|nr:glycosyltransferase family 4 protein [Parcubacteria group bacterium]
MGIDIRVLARGTYTGVEEYTRGLLDYLIPLDHSVEYRLYYNAFQKAGLENESWYGRRNVFLAARGVPNRLLDGATLLFGSPKIDRLLGGIDVLLSPHFLLTALTPRIPRVLVFHDLSYHLHPEFYSLRRRVWHRTILPRIQAEHAARIIAVSHATAADLVRQYQIPTQHIAIIGEGVHPFFQQRDDFSPSELDRVRKQYGLPDRFFLYFGTIEPRKNLIGLIRAYERIHQRVPEWKLVLAGSLGWSYEGILHAVARSPFRNDILLAGFIRQRDKPALYALASCFVYPSFFEGFGLPPLEAMASGVPTITSNGTSLPEVVGDAALLVDPYRVDEISRAMEAIATTESLQEMLRGRGFKQAARFSWKTAAARILDVLREVALPS